MALVHMMVGIPGSGKSTYSNKLHKEFGYPIVSTDVVRTLHPDWEESLIWPEVYRLCAEYLSNNQDIIYDATNITPKVRNRFCEEVNKIYAKYGEGVFLNSDGTNQIPDSKNPITKPKKEYRANVVSSGVLKKRAIKGAQKNKMV